MREKKNNRNRMAFNRSDKETNNKNIFLVLLTLKKNIHYK